MSFDSLWQSILESMAYAAGVRMEADFVKGFRADEVVVDEATAACTCNGTGWRVVADNLLVPCGCKKVFWENTVALLVRSD
jgi:hypothetical protein